MKWKDLTPEQLNSIARDLHDKAHDESVEREYIMEVEGWDAVAGLSAVARRVEREARRRLAKRAL